MPLLIIALIGIIVAIGYHIMNFIAKLIFGTVEGPLPVLIIFLLIFVICILFAGIYSSKDD